LWAEKVKAESPKKTQSDGERAGGGDLEASKSQDDQIKGGLFPMGEPGKRTEGEQENNWPAAREGEKG